jgi:hypothetical protein
LAAVRAVDAYREVFTRIYTDPAQANLGDWLTVSTDPQYTKDVQNTLANINRGYTQTGGPAIAVSRTVSAMEIVDGRSEIHVRQCQVDSPDYQPFVNGDPISAGRPDGVVDYTAQWVEAAQAWRIADKVIVSEGC